MARSILMMAAGAAGTMAGIIATGIMPASAGTAASAGMAAAATAKSLFENFLSRHAGEECSNGLPGPDLGHKKYTRPFGRAAQAARMRSPGQAEPDTRQSCPGPGDRRAHSQSRARQRLFPGDPSGAAVP